MDILKEYGRDEQKVNGGVEFFYGDEAESSLILRHSSSKEVKRARGLMSQREKHLLERGNFEQPDFRKTVAKFLVAAIVEPRGNWVWNKKKLTKPEHFAEIFADARAIEFTTQVMSDMNTGAAFGIDTFEEDSKNS